MKSIRTRLIIFFSVVLIVICAVMGFAASNRAGSALVGQGEHTLDVVHGSNSFQKDTY